MPRVILVEKEEMELQFLFLEQLFIMQEVVEEVNHLVLMEQVVQVVEGRVELCIHHLLLELMEQEGEVVVDIVLPIFLLWVVQG